MQETEQTPGQSVLAHGQSVAAFYSDLFAHLTKGTPLKNEWKLPDWVLLNKHLILRSLFPFDLVEKYQVFHDCGKPFCLETDTEGKRHFPNHAQVSQKTWLEYDGDEQIARMIGMDMDIHLLKDEGVEEFSGRPEAMTLLLTGLCEVHSNAALFGGIESVSFKIKWKQLDRRGRAICKVLNEKTLNISQPHKESCGSFSLCSNIPSL